MSLCEGCGRVYRVDVIVPDELWGLIRPRPEAAPKAGLLCGRCIMDRIEARGLHDAFKLTSLVQEDEGG